MKRIPLFFLLAMSSLHAQETVSNQTGVEQLLPSQKEFLNLPEDQRKEFITHFGEATRYFQQKRIFETLEALENAEKVFANSPELWNLKGSCYVEMRAFDKATSAFAKALELNPNNVSIQFNIAEVYFVTKQWQKANNLFEEILKKTDPKNISLGRLVEFKILLSKMKLGLNNDVQILSEKYDYLDDSPYYYYSQAALAYEKENLLAAEEWLARANRIFRDPNILAPWQDTLVEFGYIKSFYGEPDLAPKE